MKKIFVIALFSSLLFINKGFSQLPGHWSAQYEMSFATGNLKEYIEPASFRGAAIQYRAAVNENLLVGFDAAWNVFYEKKDNDTYTKGTVSLSGVQYRYQNEVPLLASVDYLLATDKALQPFVGLGLGTIYSERSTDMNLYSLYETTWQFAMKPELGILYELSYDVSIKLSAKYYNAFKTGTLDNQGYFAISTGLAFTL